MAFLAIVGGFGLLLAAYALGYQDGTMERDEAHQRERFDKLLAELRGKR